MDENSIAPNLRLIGRELVRELGVVDSASSPTDISLTQCHVLVELERHGTLTANELVDLLIVDKAAISRTVSQLVDAGLICLRQDSVDRRRKPLALTLSGNKKVADVHKSANQRVQDGLAILDPDEQQEAVRGMSLYLKALNRARLQKSFAIRPVTKADNPAVKKLLRIVISEFGESSEKSDAGGLDLDNVFRSYGQPKSKFYIVETHGRLVGCGGLRPANTAAGIPTCQLRGMVLLPEARGLGLGRLMLRRCLEDARNFGYQRCYLATKSNMIHAQKLFERFGFTKVAKPLLEKMSGYDLFYIKEFLAEPGPRRPGR